MDRTTIAIILLALGWHLNIIGLSRFIRSRRTRPSFERLLRLAEIDLLKRLRRSLEELPRHKLKRYPYRTWLKETEHWLRRISESHE